LNAYYFWVTKGQKAHSSYYCGLYKVVRNPSLGEGREEKGERKRNRERERERERER
jgi:hypothetical protein